jgi:murein DD-endopeptidase MepM/ murein hydrolase activator NlpD
MRFVLLTILVNTMEFIVLGVILLVAVFYFNKKKGVPSPLGTGLPRFSPPLSGALRLRNDSQGLGHFGAPRGSRKHQGIDIIAQANTLVTAPISGQIRRVTVYSNTPAWKGISIKNQNVEIKLFYVDPIGALPASINRGEVVGTMQNRASNSPGMVNHLHIEVWVNGKVVDPSDYFTYTK